MDQATTTSVSQPPPRLFGRRLLRGLLVALAVLLVLLAGLAWWASTEGSLARALGLAQRFLPPEQRLEYRDVSGSISRGGHVGHLQWSRPGTTLAIDDLRLSWSLWRLAGGELQVRMLHAGNVHLCLLPQPQEPDAKPFVMPRQLSLPLRVTLPLAVDRLQVDTVDAAGLAGSQLIERIAAGFAYDGAQHALMLRSLRHGQSSLRAQWLLHATELTVAGEIHASLRNLVAQAPLAMDAHLTVNGGLAGGDAARLDARLEAQEQQGDSPARLHAEATVHPWRAQPLQRLELEATALDAHAFHSAAPITAFGGRANMRPVAGGIDAWDVMLEFANEEAGTWERQRMPLRTVTAQARLSDMQLAVRQAEAVMAGSPEGRVSLAGNVSLRQPTQSTLSVMLRELDLWPWMQGLPRTALGGEASIAPLAAEEGWQLRTDVANAAAGPLDRDRLPLERLLAEARFTAARWQAQLLQLQMGAGRAQLQGEFQPGSQSLDVRGELRQLPLRQIHGRLAASADSALSGTLTARGDLREGLAFDADMSSSAGAAAARGSWEIRALRAKGSWSPSRLAVERLHLDAFGAQVDGENIEAALPEFDAIQGRLAATAPGMTMDADASMQARSGGGNLSLRLASAQQVVSWLRGLPLMGGRLDDLQARGSASLSAAWQGGWRQWMDAVTRPADQPQLHVDVNAQLQSLRLELPSAQAGQPAQSFGADRLDVTLRGNPAAADLVVDGDLRAADTRALLDMHLLSKQVAGTAGPPLWNVGVVRLAASAALPGQSGPWQLSVSEGLQLNARPGETFELDASAGQARLIPPGSVSPAGDALELAWQPLHWQRAVDGASRLRTSGTLSGLRPGWLDALLAPMNKAPLAEAGLYTDLVMSGEWNVQMTDRLDVHAHLKRDSGDLWLGQPDIDPAAGDAVRAGERVRREGVAAGIRALDVKVRSEGDDVALSLDWNTERAGVITADVRTELTRQAGGWRLADTAPLSGGLRAHLQDLGLWGFFAPPGWRVQGALGADIQLAGTVQSPQLQGGVEGSGLNIRSVLDGVDLHDGVLRGTLQGQRFEIAELTLQGGTGSEAYVRGLSGNRTQPPSERGRMTARGSIDWSGVEEARSGESGIALDLSASLQKMQVLVRNDRQLSLSGDLSAGLQQGKLTVRGDLVVDRAAIMLPEAGAPTLGDDVVVVRDSDLEGGAASGARGELQTARPMDLEIRLDLGRDLALQGHGITTRLEGELTVSSAASGNDPFRVVGEVRTDAGRFRAWGQALNVETGVVLFNGPYSNPSLNLLAIRPEIAVRAGVRVTGTLSAPRVLLYSEPDMPESEKLSWVVLGRAAATTGAEGASMQQAALGLLAGGVGSSLAGGLGLDELGLGDSSVSIGKRVSDQLYVTYEAGLSGAASTLYVFYDITRRFTVRGQTGKASAVDIIYTITYD